MLSFEEQIAFILLVIICGAIAAVGFSRIFKIIKLGAPADRSDNLVGRFIKALIDVGLQKTIFKARPLASTFHAMIFFGFSFYLLVNINDVLEAYVEGWTTIGGGLLASAFNLFSDIFSVFVLVGMVFFLIRRFIGKPKVFEFNKNVLLNPSVAAGGVKRDSLIVGIFILIHVGSRWLGTAFHLAEHGHGDPYLPTASMVAGLFSGMSPDALTFGIHLTWWLAMGLIVVFLPYFPYSKHIHLMIAPVNLALGRRTANGLMDSIYNPNSPGAEKLTDLPWPQIVDPYACIMCTRCHEVCPAHNSGTPLSPSALEINKRYLINQKGKEIAAGNCPDNLLESVISEDAVWSCTTCMACVEVCPVGNEPMADILQMRRKMVFNAQMPDELAEVLRNLDEQGNSFGESARKRTKWTKGLDEIKDPTKEPVKYLWFVGDFASFNQNCQDTTKKVARVLNAAGVDFGIVAKGEKSAGNDVRRAGEEGLFEALAEDNIAMLEGCDFEEIITTDPHTFNALKNEYPAKGGEYKVHHYSTFLLDLINNGQIELKKKVSAKVTYHDPCYLGRYNGIFDAPRELMKACGVELVEMPRNKNNSFCCGAGGGRVWMKDHDDMTQRPSENRIEEAMSLGEINYFTVACPKDMTMYADAVKTSGNEGKIEVMDIIDYVLEAMDIREPAAEEIVEVPAK
ncbi:MAG: 4Fe-4S dicluster domain-containing protein [Calditrichaeota bacterium]|nr:MAG: 4Fe-4S dicluster domain-containing protein [Calditrichota bacterium]MBL1207089.1 4Fe-4S dicluster domain-containing protein [Calditrichota bacterium]NOG46919.1 4Fe-4S dicluster domain-containing protein [Calditrichota bacterium]